MTCFYIKESKEKNKLKLLYKYIFNKLEIKDNIIELPIKVEQKLKNKKIKKIVQKLKEYNVRVAALSIGLEKQNQLKNEMYSNDMNVLDGRYLFKMLSKNILEYICKKSKCKMQDIEVSILVNDANDLNKEIILNLAEEVKTLNVITNNINSFKDIEEDLYDEKGIIINISNNKKKSLLKSKIILNLDFCEEDVNLYDIPKICVIVNTSNEIKIRTKKFNGICINYFNIIMPTKYKISGFEDEILYESLIFNLKYREAINIILEDKIRIKNLIGENGVISNNEFNKIILKILDKNSFVM